MNFWKVADGYRRENKITMGQLAEKIGISRQSLNRMMNAKDIRLNSAIMVLNAMGYSLYAGRSGEKPQKIELDDGEKNRIIEKRRKGIDNITNRAENRPIERRKEYEPIYLSEDDINI